MGLLPGLGGLIPQWGPGGPGQDAWYKDIGQVPLQDPSDIESKADLKQIRGERQENGEETYIEVKGPSKPGERSKTPYFKVLPSYKKKAEEALDKDRIPREHQKRVKDYFESLNKGG